MVRWFDISNRHIKVGEVWFSVGKNKIYNYCMFNEYNDKTISQSYVLSNYSVSNNHHLKVDNNPAR